MVRSRGGPIALIGLLAAVWVAAGCGAGSEEQGAAGGAAQLLPQEVPEDAEIVLPDVPAEEEPEIPLAHFESATHVNISTLAAQKWGLPPSRVAVIGAAADDPDVFEAGLDNAYNQQWSHAYLYTSLGFWIWGDANENFDDCITGALAGQLEGPECKDGRSAAYFYGRGDQRTGDAYLGYATHYVEDVSFVLHASFPNGTSMLTRHFDFEAWMQANWSAGHNFAATVAADNSYYAVTDLQQTIRNAAWAASYWNTSGAGRKAWSAYVASGYPTAAGTGNAELVAATKTMMIRASRYALGTVKYTLDRYGQWTSAY
jgi:hypothetical protein